MSNIANLLASSFDAFSNLYTVTILDNDTDRASLVSDLRIEGFKAPAITLGEYDLHYKTVNITRNNAMFTGEREFELKFRVDNDYVAYESLKTWRNLLYNISEDKVFLGSFSSVARLPYKIVRVKAYTGTGADDGNLVTAYGDVVKWEFKQVLLYELSEPNFTRANSEPVSVTAKFSFGEMITAISSGSLTQ